MPRFGESRRSCPHLAPGYASRGWIAPWRTPGGSGREGKDSSGMTAGDEGSGGTGSNLAYLGSHFEELRVLLASASGGPPDPARVVDLAARSVPHGTHCGLTMV